MLMVNDIIELETLFSSNNYFGNNEGDFRIVSGNIPIMLSAPHAVNCIKHGSVKYADILTGSISLLMNKLTGCHVICSTKTSDYDSNSDDCEYRETLLRYINDNDIQVLIDIHGSSLNNPCAIEMGTSPLFDEGGNIIGDELRSLKDKKYIVDIFEIMFTELFEMNNCTKTCVCVNNIFTAGKTNTITKFICDNTNCSSLQLEINRTYRNIEDEKNLNVLLVGLKNIIKKISLKL